MRLISKEDTEKQASINKITPQVGVNVQEGNCVVYNITQVCILFSILLKMEILNTDLIIISDTAVLERWEPGVRSKDQRN